MGHIILALLILLVLLLIGIPIPFSFALSSIYVFYTLGHSTGMMTSDGFEILSGFTIIAVPFFIYAGDLMGGGGIARRLVGFSNVLTKNIRGALGHVTIVSSLIFGAVSGSPVATVAVIGGLLLPRLMEQGYDRKYVASLISACGIVDLLIPPSIPVIIFASVIPGASIKAIFLAGVIPGFLLALGFMIINHFAAARMPIDSSRGFSTLIQSGSQSTQWQTVVNAIPALLMPVVILGGIYGGLFTPTEAACVACIYAIVVGCWVYKGLNWASFVDITLTSVNTTGVVLSILLFVFVLGRILTIYHVPQNLASFMLSLTSNKFILLFIIAVFLIIMGMFMDAIAGIIVCAPLLEPLAIKLGLSTTHFGIIMCLGFGVGLLTPPVAPCLFMGSRVSNLPISEFSRDVLPFLFCSFILFLLVLYIPALSNFLPNLLGVK